MKEGDTVRMILDVKEGLLEICMEGGHIVSMQSEALKKRKTLKPTVSGGGVWLSSAKVTLL